MYGRVLGCSTAAICAAATLPNTGNDVLLTVALSAAAGLTVWGVTYLRTR